jgi:hypothetical protein
MRRVFLFAFGGRPSTTWVMPPASYALVIFQIRSCVFAQGRLEHDPSIYVCFLHSWDNRPIPPCPAISWDEVPLTFCRYRSWTSILISTSRVAGMSHHTWQNEGNFKGFLGRGEPHTWDEEQKWVLTYIEFLEKHFCFVSKEI